MTADARYPCSGWFFHVAFTIWPKIGLAEAWRDCFMFTSLAVAEMTLNITERESEFYSFYSFRSMVHM